MTVQANHSLNKHYPNYGYKHPQTSFFFFLLEVVETGGACGNAKV